MSVLRTLPPDVEKVWITVEDRASSVVNQGAVTNLFDWEVENGG
jgi:hypothetical protein